MTTVDRLPPHSVEAEEAVLGSLLIDPDAIVEVASFLRPDAFYREQNKWIYQAILDLHEAREALDFITLADTLRKRSQLEDVGGEAYLISLLNAVPTSVNARSYGRIVEAAAVRRRMLTAASSIANLAYDEDENVNVILDRAEQALFSISEERTTRDLVPVRDIARAYLDRVEELHARGDEMIGVPSGFTDVDKMLAGLNKSDLLIVAARPGMGKTSFLLGMALHAGLRHGKRIAMFNLEMSGEQLVQRMIAAETRIDSQRLRRGQLYENEWPIFLEAVGRLSEMRVFIDDTRPRSRDGRLLAVDAGGVHEQQSRSGDQRDLPLAQGVGARVGRARRHRFAAESRRGKPAGKTAAAIRPQGQRQH